MGDISTWTDWQVITAAVASVAMMAAVIGVIFGAWCFSQFLRGR